MLILLSVLVLAGSVPPDKDAMIAAIEKNNAAALEIQKVYPGVVIPWNFTISDHIDNTTKKAITMSVPGYKIDPTSLVTALFYQVQDLQKQVNDLKAQSNGGTKALAESTLYTCESNGIKKECPGGLGGTTRCYQDVNKTSWFNCATGWKIQ